MRLDDFIRSKEAKGTIEQLLEDNPPTDRSRFLEIYESLAKEYRDRHGVSNTFKAFWHSRSEYLKSKILGSFPERARVISNPMLTGRLYSKSTTVDEIYAGIIEEFFRAYRNAFTHQGMHRLPPLGQIDSKNDATRVVGEVVGTGFYETENRIIENRFPLLPFEAKAIVDDCESIVMLLHGDEPRVLPGITAEDYFWRHYEWSSYLHGSSSVETIHRGFINVLKATVYDAICHRLGREPKWWIFSGSEIAKRHDILI